MKKYKIKDDNDLKECEKLSISTDILIFSVSDEIQSNYRKLNKKHFSVLLAKRDTSRIVAMSFCEPRS